MKLCHFVVFFDAESVEWSKQVRLPKYWNNVCESPSFPIAGNLEMDNTLYLQYKKWKGLCMVLKLLFIDKQNSSFPYVFGLCFKFIGCYFLAELCVSRKNC